MRTIVTIQDELLRRAREASVRRGCTLSEVVEDALRVALISGPKSEPARTTRRWKTFRGSGVRAGTDLNSSATLLDVMEEP